MRRILVLAISMALLLVWSGAASAQQHRGQCRKLSRQINHYMGVAEMAADRGDERWLAGTEAHLNRLTTRLYRLCPEYKPENMALRVMKWLGTVAKVAAKGFAKFITFGAYAG